MCGWGGVFGWRLANFFLEPPRVDAPMCKVFATSHLRGEARRVAEAVRCRVIQGYMAACVSGR